MGAGRAWACRGTAATAALTVAATVLGARPAAAQIYVWHREDGSPVYTTEYRPGATVFMATPYTSGQAGSRPLRVPYAGEIAAAARQAGLDPLLVEAVVAAESGFDPHAVSHRGARGLMQLMPSTAARYGVADLWDPADNLRAGAAYLRDLLATYRRLELALAAYNAGEAAVERYRGVPPYPETEGFVRRVLGYYGRRLGGR